MRNFAKNLTRRKSATALLEDYGSHDKILINSGRLNQ